MVASLLLERGHKRIAFLAGLENSSTNLERERGFKAVLDEAGVQLHSRAVGHYSFERAQQAARTLFATRDRPDAVFVANDHMAIAVIKLIYLVYEHEH